MTVSARIIYALLVLFLISLMLGCSGGSQPTEPPLDNPATLHQDSVSTDQAPRIVLGAYKLVFGENGTVDIIPMRLAEMHIDVTSMVFPPACVDCFGAEVLGVTDNIWDFRFTLRNSTPVTGYDVRATLLDLGTIGLITQADSFTDVFALPLDPDPRNPYFIFNSNQGQNAWPPLAMADRDISFFRPTGSKFSEITVVIDASWPSNQDDPTGIFELKPSKDSIYDDGSNSTNFTCQIPDWQDDIESVEIDLSPIGGNPHGHMSQAVNGTWFLNGLMCGNGIEPGEKTIWVTATSGGMSVYNKTTIIVEQAPIVPPPDPAVWTMMVYMHEGGLPDEEDINEMEMSGELPDEFNIIVLWDLDDPAAQDKMVYVKHDPNGYNLDMVSEFIDDDGEVIPPGGLVMGDEETLEKFIRYCFENYPAQHYILDLWDHGAGIFQDPSKPPLFRNVCNGLNLWELRMACENALAEQTLVDKIDIIGFDVCSLGWIETAYALRNVTDYVIASELSEPGPGWDYGPPFTNLRDNIDTYTADQICWDVSEYYIISYTDPNHPYHYPVDDITQAASSVERMMNIAIPALNNFSDICIANLPDIKADLSECIDNMSWWGWGWGVGDIGHFAYVVKNHPGLPQEVRDAASALDDAVEEAMVHHGHNGSVPDEESGWMIWLPANITQEPSNFQMEYLESGYLEFYETQWDEFLFAFSGEIITEEGWLTINDVTFSDASGGNNNGIIEPDEIIDITVNAINNGTGTATNCSGLLHPSPGSESIYEILDDTSAYPDIDPGNIAPNNSSFRIHIQPACLSGSTAEFLIDFSCDQSQSTNLPFSLPVDPGEILIFNFDTSNNSAPGLRDAILANGHTADITTSAIADVSLDYYSAVFIADGMDQWTAPSFEDYDAIKAYLLGGGNVYMEGSDIWVYLAGYGNPDFGPLFGIQGIADGWMGVNDPTGVAGTPLDGLQFTYSGDNMYPDQIDASTSAPGAMLVMTATDVDSVQYGAVVTNDEGTYKTVGASFELAGLDDGAGLSTKAELMRRILEFFGM